MLGGKDAFATAAVKDLDKARPFYEEILGLQRVGDDMPGVQGYRAGSTTIIVYQSPTGGSNPATSITWSLGEDFDDILKQLQAKGVRFEHYDMPGTRLEGDVHVSGSGRVAWFKDPDGNIINIGNYPAG